MKLLLALLIVAAPASATTWRKVIAYRGFDGMQTEMQHLVDRDPDDRARLNHLCVVVEDPDNSKSDVGPIAWVHLQERAYLFAFTLPAHPPINDGSIWGGASVDLKRDVVASERDIRGSTSRRTRADVNRIITACARYGNSVVIEKRYGQ